MNKAFVKEPEPGVERCPQCGAPGDSVGEETLAFHIQAGHLAEIAKTANFCGTPSCEVAYFDSFERVILVSALKHPVYPKDLDAPICPCFGLTCAEIDQDLAEGVVTRTKAAVARAKSLEAQCRTQSPRGESCVGDVQRYYMQHKENSSM